MLHGEDEAKPEIKVYSTGFLYFISALRVATIL